MMMICQSRLSFPIEQNRSTKQFCAPRSLLECVCWLCALEHTYPRAEECVPVLAAGRFYQFHRLTE